MATCERRILTAWRAPPTASAFAIRLDFCDSPSRGGNRRACIDLLGGKVAGIGWPPHRISLRLRLDFCDSPSRGE